VTLFAGSFSNAAAPWWAAAGIEAVKQAATIANIRKIFMIITSNLVSWSATERTIHHNLRGVDLNFLVAFISFMEERRATGAPACDGPDHRKCIDGKINVRRKTKGTFTIAVNTGSYKIIYTA
jgi:hypothetical protein